MSVSLLSDFVLPGPGAMSLIVKIKEGDITREPVDAIVNAANNHMLGGSGVDGAIHDAAGDELYYACRDLPIIAQPDVRVETGDAVLLPGFDLTAKHIISAVGPIFNAAKARESEELFVSAYSRSLDIAAAEEGIDSVAFPAISCGIYGFPPKKGGRLVMELLKKRASEGIALKEVRVVLFGKAMFHLWVKRARRIFEEDDGGGEAGGQKVALDMKKNAEAVCASDSKAGPAEERANESVGKANDIALPKNDTCDTAGGGTASKEPVADSTVTEVADGTLALENPSTEATAPAPAPAAGADAEEAAAEKADALEPVLPLSSSSSPVTDVLHSPSSK